MPVCNAFPGAWRKKVVKEKDAPLAGRTRINNNNGEEGGTLPSRRCRQKKKGRFGSPRLSGEAREDGVFSPKLGGDAAFTGIAKHNLFRKGEQVAGQRRPFSIIQGGGGGGGEMPSLKVEGFFLKKKKKKQVLKAGSGLPTGKKSGSLTFGKEDAVLGGSRALVG